MEEWNIVKHLCQNSQYSHWCYIDFTWFHITALGKKEAYCQRTGSSLFPWHQISHLGRALLTMFFEIFDSDKGGRLRADMFSLARGHPSDIQCIWMHLDVFGPSWRLQMPNPKDHKHGLVHILVHTLVLLLHFPYLTIPILVYLGIAGMAGIASCKPPCWTSNPTDGPRICRVDTGAGHRDLPGARGDPIPASMATSNQGIQGVQDHL